MTLSHTARRLSAILVADAVGYSRLVEIDEQGTLSALRNLRQEVLDPLLADHGGRTVKLLGDGLIAEFGSVVDAVTCAAAWQVKAAELQETVPPDRRILFRVGINLGDVVTEDDDLLGDGVNVAARLEQLCQPGGVMISGTAYDQLHGKLDILFAFVGDQHLKNISRPIRAYQMVRDGTSSGLPWSSHSDRPAIAVLPFENLSGDPDQAYFSDGMTEEVMTELSRFRELVVIARGSSAAFSSKDRDVRAVGRQLGASYLLEGSVRRAANRVRISAQLLEAATGANVWADRYDRPMEDIFAIQEEIAQSIVARVAQHVRDDSGARARRRQPEDLRAYDLYIQGNSLSDDLTPEIQARIEGLFREARRIDPTFARAYSGLSYVTLNRSLDGGIRPYRTDDDDQLEALRLAEEALVLDPNDPRIHMTFGFTCLYLRQFARAQRHLDLARTMNPNDPTIQMVWAWAQGCIGKPSEGLPAASIAFRLNPHHPWWYEAFLGRLLYQLRRYAEAGPLLELGGSPSPVRELRHIGWRAANSAQLGRDGEAHRLAGLFVTSAAALWRGGEQAGPTEFVNWLVDSSLLQRAEDIENLRDGLALAGLPT